MKLLTQTDLKKLFFIDTETGSCFRRDGRKAVSLTQKGYQRTSVAGREYRVHRLVWLWVHGKHPPEGMTIDHINGNKVDNRISNLRVATTSQNKQNARKARLDSKSGLIGATWYSRCNKWRAAIQVDGKKKHLGYFDEVEKAHAVYIEAKRTLHPFCTI